MQHEYRFSLSLRNGLHARPASMLAETARRFTSDVRMVKAADGSGVDAKSVLSLVGMDLKEGDVCVVEARGFDSPAVIAAIKELVEHRLAEGDELPPAPVDPTPGLVSLMPIGLRKLDLSYAVGRAACAGVGRGAAVVVDALTLPAEERALKAASAEVELQRVCGAVAAVREDLEKRAATAGHGLEADLLRAHGEIVDDPALRGELEKEIKGGATAPQAVVAAGERFAEKLRGAQSAYIRDRVVDVQDICMQLLERLIGGATASMQVALTEDSVVFAETLTANQLLKMDRSKVKGLALGRIGATAHTVILARSLRIPTLIDVANPGAIVGKGSRVILDATSGIVITNAVDGAVRYYDREARTQARMLAKLGPLAQRPAMTMDGQRMEVGANASTAEEVNSAVSQGAEGVGLLRTELLFLDREHAPTEDEQYEAYSAVVNAAAGRPVIIRTFDIGGDKPAEYVTIPAEENPFLGVRGLRLYERYPGLLRSQLRAILRASARGPVKIMAPMVATVGEAAWFRSCVKDVQRELHEQGVAFDADAPIGVMIEIPSAAFAMDELSEHVDFFSIGTNDLCQYFMAVDRGNAGVASLYNARQPSFLRLLKSIVDGARRNKRWIGVCGEMAGAKLNLMIMLGLGVDEISVSPGEILGLKSLICSTEGARCREVLDAAMKCKDAASVESLLAEAIKQPRCSTEAAPLLDAEMMEIESDALTKEEAIKDAVDLLALAGRTERPRDVEDAVWKREATYSTGLGYGFAVPHCKTDAIGAPALAVLKLKEGIEWGSMDGNPVRMVLLLSIPASDTTGAHMKVFAKLARKLMHDEFRERMMGAADRGAVMACLKEELGLE